MNIMKIILVGAEGYIGSVLWKELSEFDVVGVDHKNNTGNTIIAKNNSELISVMNRSNDCNVIIYLGGVSSRQMTDADISKNLEILEIVQRMTPNQLLIYASTAAIYEGKNNARETDVIDEKALDAYSLSMYMRERLILQVPNRRTIGLRLATVIGRSNVQRSDRVHIQMLKSALLTKRMEVENPFSLRAILTMKDLVNAVRGILQKAHLIGGHHIYNLSSFNTCILAIASSIALNVSAKVKYHSVDNKLSKGFSTDCGRLIRDFGIKLGSNNEEVIDDLLRNRLLGAWSDRRITDSRCLVCSGGDLIRMIDLGKQPLANKLTRVPECEHFPLAMDRCLHCYHHQLHDVVPPERLFMNYNYVSGTTRTMLEHFKWFSNKVTNETSPCDKGQRVVLEIACNDGSQLNAFKERGWRTIGVDPARNLAKITQYNGHEIFVDFWGDPTVTSKLPKVQFDAIVAQNVLAHVPNPRNFLTECHAVMNDETKLYIQTSQAELFQTGEFDTIYHEHISFFTVRSMCHLSKACRLEIMEINKVPVHGISYLFVLRRQRSQGTNASVSQMLEIERSIYDDLTPMMYRFCVDQKVQTIKAAVMRCRNDGFKLVGFGAAAKATVFLNFARGMVMPEYVIDDNVLKQNHCIPGVNVPIVDYDTMKPEPGPLAILVLAWNFLDEIKNRIANDKDVSKRRIVLIVAFPQPAVWLLRNDNWQKMSEIPFPKVSVGIPVPSRPRTLLITHIYNEELLLPYWIQNHAPLFDDVVIIDYQSTDRGLDIVRNTAPAHWRIIPSSNTTFGADATDQEVRRIERTYPDETWKITLTITEFIVWPNMWTDLASAPGDTRCLSINSVNIVGDDTAPLTQHQPLVQQRCQYTRAPLFNYSRFMHRFTNKCDNIYSIGRHSVNIPSSPVPGAILFKYLYSPWPESIPRKLQIKCRQFAGDVARGAGFQHQYDLETLQRMRELATAPQNLSVDLFRNSLNHEHGDSLNDQYLLFSSILHDHLQIPWSTKIPSNGITR